MAPIVTALINAGMNLLGNAVASKGKEVIEEKLGVNIGNLLGTEEGKIKLLQLENEHEEALQRLAIDRRSQELEQDKLAYQDVDSARKMQIAALGQSDVLSKRFIYYLAAGWSLFSATYIIGITFFEVPMESIRFADTILGFLLGTIVSTILNFFFGSSKTSKEKDYALVEALKGVKNEFSS